jgi:hypothetical protein
MSKKLLIILASISVGLTASRAQAEDQKTPYPAMVPVERYMIADTDSEIALARTAAVPSISGDAEVMVLGKQGYTAAAKGSNGFVCMVERGWGAGTDDPNFWNPRIRAPICFNAAAAQSFLPIYLMKTKLVLAGKSKTEMVQAMASALDKKQLPALEPGAMCYMMSKQQYLNDGDTHNWHPHMMFFVAGDVAKSWGADLPASPVMAANDPEERATIFMVWVQDWSDGTPGPGMH